ncbi:unnamed protein product [Cylindrotheca closterium]|uniref:Trichome birefringence-like C-terminal domain-containing protein n=1 Tax=Cylindrotheca closterium TaxID=2856 RepID=A0AAD2JKC4_9STRA|nr:unnamed protein product [Cylindrotheca closterium]
MLVRFSMGKCNTTRGLCLLLFIAVVISLVMASSAALSKHADEAMSSSVLVKDQSPPLSAIRKNSDACQDACLWKSGINGSWVQDFDFARDHGQFEKPLVIKDGPFQRRTAGAFQPSEDAPFPWRTSWRWVDHESDCQVDILTLDKFCKVLQKLNVQRILFFGDSLTDAMYTGLANKIGHANFRLNPDNQRNGSMICPVGGVHGADDRIIPVFDKKVSADKVRPNTTRKMIEFDHEVRHFLDISPADRVLAVFNIGAHYHDVNHYRQDLGVMLNLLSNMNRSQDLYIFRATSPGHEGCLPRTRKFDWKVGTRIVPLAKFEDYKVTVGHQHDWDKFEGYNNYTKYVLLEHNRKGLGPIYHYLDIFNMTALRHDAHAAPADCLHFQAPGPVDWWNHFLFTYLSRLSKDGQLRGKGSMREIPTNCRRSS